MIFKYYYQVAGGHVHVKMFAGRREEALGKAGEFVLRKEEWDAFSRGAHSISSGEYTAVFLEITGDVRMEAAGEGKEI